MKTLADAIVWLDSVEDPEFCGFTKPGWYFWDETQSQCHGPYSFWHRAYKDLEAYIEILKGGSYDNRSR